MGVRLLTFRMLLDGAVKVSEVMFAHSELSVAKGRGSATTVYAVVTTIQFQAHLLISGITGVVTNTAYHLWFFSTATTALNTTVNDIDGSAKTGLNTRSSLVSSRVEFAGYHHVMAGRFGRLLCHPEPDTGFKCCDPILYYFFQDWPAARFYDRK